eukprot:5803522-Alexandrium_andersonii.AAC.1
MERPFQAHIPHREGTARLRSSMPTCRRGANAPWLGGSHGARPDAAYFRCDGQSSVLLEIT